MATTNNITGDSLISKLGNKEAQDNYATNYDAIFGKKKKADDWDEARIDIIGQNGATGEHYDKV